MKYISDLLIPIMILGVIIYGMTHKINIYDSFIRGAKEGIKNVIRIFPYTVSMVFAVNIFLHSGILKFMIGLLKNVIQYNVPLDILPMAFLRPISGSASEIVMLDIFNRFGPDSLIGMIASTLQGSTDTTFYVITLYFGSIGIKKVRHALKAGLFADLIGIISSILIIYIMFGTR